MNDGYWFKSDLFKVQPGEEDFTNPGRFGKSLAEWLSEKLSDYGYKTEVIPEDWGWCVICANEEFMLWAGCGTVVTEEILDSSLENPPDEKNFVWHVFAESEIPFFQIKSILKKWFGKIDLAVSKNKLSKEISEILSNRNDIQLCDAPDV